MQGKLIDVDNIYTLIVNGKMFASNDEDFQNDYEVKKLSLKNCQSIKRGYDLDELAKNFAIKELADPNDYEHSIYASTIENTYMSGFLKALEILGDKKFSEFLDREKVLGISDKKTIERIQWYYNTYFDKSKQTEWDVEIVMICPHPQDTYVCGIQYGCDEDGCNHPNQVPKLDADGCLILKRI